ncbi:MAG: DUF484 family protein [Caulobacteraceae bacterium]
MRELAEAMVRPASNAIEEVKALILAHRSSLLEDADFLRQIGVRADSPARDEAANVIHFGPVALSRAAAAHRRESGQRRRLESVARANFAAQAQTHAAVIELLESRDHADLARRLGNLARSRFGLAAAVLAVETETAAPVGWRVLAPGQVDMVLGPGRAVRMGLVPTALGLFGGVGGGIGSVALIRLRLWPRRRAGLMAFASSDPEGFTDDMGADLIAFVARVAERCAERWPAP